MHTYPPRLFKTLFLSLGSALTLYASNRTQSAVLPNSSSAQTLTQVGGSAFESAKTISVEAAHKIQSFSSSMMDTFRPVVLPEHSFKAGVFASGARGLYGWNFNRQGYLLVEGSLAPHIDKTAKSLWAAEKQACLSGLSLTPGLALGARGFTRYGVLGGAVSVDAPPILGWDATYLTRVGVHLEFGFKNVLANIQLYRPVRPFQILPSQWSQLQSQDYSLSTPLFLKVMAPLWKTDQNLLFRLGVASHAELFSAKIAEKLSPESYLHGDILILPKLNIKYFRWLSKHTNLQMGLRCVYTDLSEYLSDQERQDLFHFYETSLKDTVYLTALVKFDFQFGGSASTAEYALGRFSPKDHFEKMRLFDRILELSPVSVRTQGLRTLGKTPILQQGLQEVQSRLPSVEELLSQVGLGSRESQQCEDEPESPV